MHAEIHERVGFGKMLKEIPAWFDEGLAMQVDNRPNYNLTKEQLPETLFVRQLNSYREFHQTKNSYPAAKKEVKFLIEKMNEKKLFDSLELVRTGKSFNEVFLQN